MTRTDLEQAVPTFQQDPFWFGSAGLYSVGFELVGTERGGREEQQVTLEPMSRKEKQER